MYMSARNLESLFGELFGASKNSSKANPSSPPRRKAWFRAFGFNECDAWFRAFGFNECDAWFRAFGFNECEAWGEKPLRCTGSQRGSETSSASTSATLGQKT
jgi:hypothetical protein